MSKIKDFEDITKKIFRYYFHNAMPKLTYVYCTTDISVRRRIIRRCKKFGLKVSVEYPKRIGNRLLYSFRIDPFGYEEITDWIITECALNVIAQDYPNVYTVEAFSL